MFLCKSSHIIMMLYVIATLHLYIILLHRWFLTLEKITLHLMTKLENMLVYITFAHMYQSYSHVRLCIFQMYFINSLLSLYFPYDFCLYSGATPLAMYAFRYFPLCLTIIICSVGLALQ